MKYIIFLQLFCIFFATHQTNAQYFEKVGPKLKVGNFWVHNSNPGGVRTKREVVKDTLINSLIYYKVRFTFSNSPEEEFKFYRNNDSSFLAVYIDSAYKEDNHEFLYYKIDTQLGDFWAQLHPASYPPYIYYSVVSMSPAVIFGEIDTIKHLYIQDSTGLWEYNQIWAEEFGMLHEWTFGYEEKLSGCFLDGIAYGDTNIVTGIDDEIVLHKFELYQNYPNPFNPETKIKFTVRQLSDVNLTVYDPLGRVVAILVNEEKTAGTFEVKFNAENLASGVYLYRLQVEDFVSTKKMALIK